MSNAMSQEQLNQEIADDVEKAGFIGIIGLLSLIASICTIWKACHPDPTSVKSYLQSNYDGTEFSDDLMRKAMHHAKVAARKQHTHVTDDELRAIAKASLLKAMNSSDDTVRACYTQE